MEGSQRCLTLKIVFAVIGILSGASIFICFLSFRNVNAAIWGLVTAIFAAVVLALHISYKRRVLHVRFTADSLKIVKIFGIVSSVAAIAATISYFMLANHLKQGYKIEDDGYAPAGVFALLSLKWTFMMFWEGRKYEKFLLASGDMEITSISNDETTSHYNTAQTVNK